MPEPILAVDLGGSRTWAALVTGHGWQLVTRPDASGASWPPVGVPADRVVVADRLERIRAEVRRQYRLPVSRLAAASPAPAGPGPAGGRASVVTGGQAAGFLDVELVPSTVAAVLDPASGPDWRPGDVVLACLLGDTWSTWNVALVRLGDAGDECMVLATAAGPGRGPDLADQLAWVVASGSALVARSGAPLAGVALAGCWAARGDVVAYLQQALPGPVRPAYEPELAVLRGVARWAAGAPGRQVPAEPSRWRVAPLAWRIPDHGGQVLRWLVPEGAPFAAGAVLAQVRTATDRVYDLTAAADGAMLAHGTGPGARTGPVLVAAVAPAPTGVEQHPPAHRHRWSTAGGVMLTGEQLVEWDAAGRSVHTREVGGGAVTRALRPDHGPAQPERARCLVDPDGRLCLLTWNRDGAFWVWDVAAGELRTTFTGAGAAERVLVDEQGWRLAVEAGDAVSVGRYRRTAVTLWDLASGDRLDRVVADDWRRRLPGFAERSAADRFADTAVSADQRLRTVVADGSMTLYETATDRPVFRVPAPGRTQTAFSADGRFLLTSSRTEDRSTVDVWQL